jgi:cardiolipin synthase
MLTDAARRGVSVRLLVDAVGSILTPDSFWRPFREAGGEVRWFRPVLRGWLPFRDHRKLLMADGAVALVGGFNIADEYFGGRAGEPPWRDVGLLFEGAGIAGLPEIFDRQWERSGRPLSRRLLERRGPGVVDQGGAVRFVASGPEDRSRPVRRVYRQLINGASRGIDLEMAYFYPPGRILRALAKASRRGVKVRLILPGRTDVPVAGWAAHGLYGRLMRAGIAVHEYQPSVLHAKLVVADDTVVTGSANLDLRSDRMNYELVAIVADADVAARAREVFERDLAASVPVDPAAWERRPFGRKVLERLSYLVIARLDPFLRLREGGGE